MGTRHYIAIGEDEQKLLKKKDKKKNIKTFNVVYKI